MARFLRHQGVAARIYIPDRLFEGYGPNVEALKVLAAEGARLVICLDCGSTSFEALEAARDLGLTVVVIDHHEVGVDLPHAHALVNPNRQDDLSGLGYLCAVGVTLLATVAINRTFAGAAGTGRAAASPTSSSGSIWWRSARSATWFRWWRSTGRWSPRACWPWRAARTRASRRLPISPASAPSRRRSISASCSGRASMPAGGSAMRRSARAC